MTVKQSGALGVPDSRTRSIWLTQLSLAVSVVVLIVAILVIDPVLFARPTVATGILIIVIATVATLAAPRRWLRSKAVIAIPFVDAAAVGLMSYDSDLRFGAFWIFPVMWVAMRFSPIALAGMLALIAAMLLASALTSGTGESPLRIVLTLLSLGFLGITAHITMRAAKAYRTLMRRQARRLQATLDRSSRQERRVRDLLNGLDTAVARVTPSGRIVTTNDAYVRLYGLDPHDVAQPARSIEYDAEGGIPLPADQRPVARAARGETLDDLRVWLYTVDGSWRALSITTKREGDQDDEDTRTLLFVHDVTEVVLAERERRRLAAIASHELKHPLTAVLGYAELALEADDLPPRTRDQLESIHRASERMLEMTTTLLTEPGQRTTATRPRQRLDLRDIVRESVESFAAAAAAKDIAFAVEADEPLPIVGDAFRLRQVVDNLVSNAVKYTPRGGHVWMSAGREDADAVVAITDTGIGIGAEHLADIFTPYFRTDEAVTSAPGTGLGLGISREIVLEHDGGLTVDSERGAGTTVTLRLPYAAASTQRQAMA
jgi:two-component system phosphate regulon sensor histidine kinase PhoR